jgi:hypothetical protein
MPTFFDRVLPWPPDLPLLTNGHTKLTFRFQGRNFRLTDVDGKIVTRLFA